MEKCSTCKKSITPNCDYNQGRCPHLPAVTNLEKIKIIMAWIIVLLCVFNMYLYWSTSDTVYAWLVAFIGWLNVALRKGK
jgi:heme O synthase-like polyprenyltransferase